MTDVSAPAWRPTGLTWAHTDTALDDHREFSVYLAHHGSVVKAGITASERGQARLLEQGALSSLILSTGTLLSARRCEALLTTALGVPQDPLEPGVTIAGEIVCRIGRDLYLATPACCSTPACSRAGP